MAFPGPWSHQLTGRGNYATVGAALGLDLIADPDLLLDRLPAARSAAYFWKSHGLNELADDRSDDDDDKDFVTITRKTNAAGEGLTRRRAYWQTAKAILAS